jgi:hypothetical protein
LGKCGLEKGRVRAFRLRGQGRIFPSIRGLEEYSPRLHYREAGRKSVRAGPFEFAWSKLLIDT